MRMWSSIRQTRMKNKQCETSGVMIAPRRFTDDDVQQLLLQLEQELFQIYPAMPALTSLQPMLTLVAYQDGQALACVALMPLAEGEAEIKRLFVMPSARRLGLAKRLLHELEQFAVQQGMRRILVETGYLQAAAIMLYQWLGYQQIAPYGTYIGNPVSRCFGKVLLPEQTKTPA